MRRFSSSERRGFRSWCAALNVSRRLTSTVAGLVMTSGGSDCIHVHDGRDQPCQLLQALRSTARPADSKFTTQPQPGPAPDCGRGGGAAGTGPGCDNRQMPERLEVQRAVAASAGEIFAVLTDPQGHVAIDSSGMLMEASGDV